MTGVEIDINNFIIILKNISTFANLKYLSLNPTIRGGYLIDYDKIFDSFFQSLKRCLFLNKFIYGDERSFEHIFIIKNSVFPFLDTISINYEKLKTLFLNAINFDGKLIFKKENLF